MYIFFSPYVAGTGEYENEDLRLIFSQKNTFSNFIADLIGMDWTASERSFIYFKQNIYSNPHTRLLECIKGDTFFVILPNTSQDR